ncbi:MAG: hypothetical protein F6K21_33910 [Symploca sp. SIO2D2]|nr:hypothetical protein [Symploca sp. SIO2D2]
MPQQVLQSLPQDNNTIPPMEPVGIASAIPTEVVVNYLELTFLQLQAKATQAEVTAFVP